VPLFGDFNSENVLTVLAVMLAMGVSMPDAVKKLEYIKPVAGRMERFGGDGQPLIFVDYAHTPDALDKVLSSMRKHCLQPYGWCSAVEATGTRVSAPKWAALQNSGRIM